MNAAHIYWQGERLVLTDGKVTFQSARLADRSKRTEAIWQGALTDRYRRHIDGGKQLDGVYKLSESLFQVAG